jgi:putative phosphoribosyl transferase
VHFRDRVEAGQRLVKLVQQYQSQHPLVIGVPDGGVPVALEVAAALQAPFEVWAGEKLGSPEHPGLRLGAIAEGDVVFLDHSLPTQMGTQPLEALIARKQLLLHERSLRLRGSARLPDVTGRTVLVVDDGVATGATLHAVLLAVKSHKPRELVVAVPVGAISRLAALRRIADHVHALEETRNLVAIGAWYDDFTRVPEPQIADVLRHPSRALAHSLQSTEALPANTREIDVHVEGVTLCGTLAVPHDAKALVIVASASGTSRFDASNRFLAAELRKRNLATLLFDLLTHREELRALEAGKFRFDLELLSRRLLAATHWVAHNRETEWMRVGFLEGPIGPGVALDAAARRPNVVQAIAAIGASPHIARSYFGKTKAPTLWLVGETDAAVLSLDPKEIAAIFGEADLEIVPGAGALFEEPGALEQVSALASRWFERWLVAPGAAAFKGVIERQAPAPSRRPMFTPGSSR